jgi:hypothetical protein
MLSMKYPGGRRLWVIRDYTIWGLADEARFYYQGVEEVNSVKRVMFGIASINGMAQNIAFSDLVDFRGNNLPSTIKSPKIMVQLRSPYPVFLVGPESDTGFRIARSSDAPGPVKADLFVFEMDS